MSGTNIRGFTKYGWTVCVWILIATFQYGYHISVLNQIQAVVTCKTQHSHLPRSGLPFCLPMSDTAFSAVTAIFTLGGLCGSLVASVIMDRWGRWGATNASALCNFLGAFLMGVASSTSSLAFGRYLVGIGSGVALCLVPVFLSEITPSRISGSVGVLTQLSIVIGIMVTQAMGLRLATPTEWRSVLFFSSALSVIHLVLSICMVESPIWLGNQRRQAEKNAVSIRLWGPPSVQEGPDSDPLLDELEAHSEHPLRNATTVPQLFVSNSLRRPLTIVCLAMVTQQLSGINAVLYYSNEILSKSLPDLGPYVSLSITIVNALMTFPPIVLVDRLGRKQLLTISCFCAFVSLVLAGYSLDANMGTLSSISTTTFVMSFAIGLGPIPFIMIPEVSPSYGVSSISSVAFSLNWICNFLVGLLFLPTRNLLSGGDPAKEGRVFYAFGTVLILSSLMLLKLYRA